MTFIAFILGVTLGIGIYFWKQYQFRRQLRRMLNSLSPNTDQVKSLSIISIVRREINRLNQQRQQLEEELQTWQELLEVAPIGYLRVDEENQLLWCNQQARQLLNIDRWQPEQVRLLLELVRSYELDQLIEQTRHSQQPQVQEWVFYAANYAPGGKMRERHEAQLFRRESLALKASSCPLPQGQVAVFLENQQPLVELSQSRDRAFSDLTHELRTPLTSISLVTEALQKRLQNPERRWVEQMLQETNRLINLVQDWLDISQLQEDPSQHLHYQSIELRELIFSIWQIIDPLAKQKEVTLAYSGSDRLYLQADKSRLTQVFLNLFDNGIKHSPPQGVIRVEVEVVAENSETELTPESSAGISINIIDSGSGFSESDLPYVFDRLYRGEISRSRQLSNSELPEALPPRHGSGLGLSIAQQIIEAHGGSIEAKNHPETGGAWLQIKLPPSSPD
ncbi:MAG: sensor histidine kinase [Xenococcaceae cyanobacterium]